MVPIKKCVRNTIDKNIVLSSSHLTYLLAKLIKYCGCDVSVCNVAKYLCISLQVLEYIRRAKAWRNNTWNDDESGRPSSYMVELLVIKAYENGGRIDSPQQYAY